MLAVVAEVNAPGQPLSGAGSIRQALPATGQCRSAEACRIDHFPGLQGYACSSTNGQGMERAVRANRSEEHTSELQSRPHLVCRLLLEKKKKKTYNLCGTSQATHST